jgi:hypothetical protein
MLHGFKGKPFIISKDEVNRSQSLTLLPTLSKVTAPNFEL